MNNLVSKNNSFILKESSARKLDKLLDCIESIEEKDGNYFIKYNSNVMEIFPQNYIKIVNGVDITKAELIHLNPEIEITPEKQIQKMIEESK